MKTVNIQSTLLTVTKALLLISILVTSPIYAEKETKTGWRKTAAELDNAGSDASDAIDKTIDKVTKKIIGQSAGDKVGKAKNALGVVDDILDIEDKTVTIIEGIQEGDPAKIISPIVGQDTADKISAKDAKEYDKEEGKALTAKEAEVRQALKAKLRRKGATKEEAEAAMKLYDNGNKKEFHNAVKKIKAKGIEDQDRNKHGLTPDAKSDDEFNVKDPLYEGAKAEAKKVDNFYGGIVQKQQASNKEFEKLKKEQDQTQQGIQDEVDNAVVKKMMRKGVSYKDARDALDAKRKGDSSKFNAIAKKIANKKDLGQKDSGLTAEGKTSTFEADDYGKDIIDKEKQAWEDRSKKMMRAPNKILDYLDKKDLAEKDEQQRENNIYGKLRKAGATKKEARTAASDYAKGNPEKVIKLAKELKKRRSKTEPTPTKKDKDYTIPTEENVETGEGKTKQETKGKIKSAKMADDIFGDTDSSADKNRDEKKEANDIFPDDNTEDDNATTESKNNNKNLKDSEYADDYVDLPDDNQKDTAEMAILRKELKRQKENAFSAKVNRTKNEMANAATSGNQSVRDSQAKIDQANVEGAEIKTAAADKSTADYENNSFGERMSTEVTAGIKQGMETAGTAVGTAIGQAMARKIIHNKNREERREEWNENNNEDGRQNAPTGDNTQVASSGNRQSSGNGSRRSSGGRSSQQIAGGKGTKNVSGVKPVNKGTCPMCNVGKMGPWRTDNPTYDYRFCRLCGYKQTKTKSSASKTPTAIAGSHKCEYCGAPGVYSTDGKYYYCKNHVVYMPPKKTSTPQTATTKQATASKPKGWRCPSCGSYDTVFKHSHPLYGDVYHCNGCGGTVHNI